MSITLALIIGVVIGGVLGTWLGKKNAPASVFEEGSEEADELRAKGARAVSERIQKRKDRIMLKAKENKRITNDGVEDLFCISDRTASNYLSVLVKEGKLEKIGTSGRGVHYIPKD